MEFDFLRFLEDNEKDKKKLREIMGDLPVGTVDYMDSEFPLEVRAIQGETCVIGAYIRRRHNISMDINIPEGAFGRASTERVEFRYKGHSYRFNFV